MNLCLKSDRSVLLIVDIQAKLAAAMTDAEQVIQNTIKLGTAAKTFEIPIIISEQYPEGIGPTDQRVNDAVSGSAILSKMTFSCMDDEGLKTTIKDVERQQIVVCGMETHVCVLQTVMGLIAAGYDVSVVADAVSSRMSENKQLGLERMKAAGAQIVSTEMVMFEWLGRAGTPEFKQLLKLIK